MESCGCQGDGVEIVDEAATEASMGAREAEMVIGG